MTIINRTKSLCPVCHQVIQAEVFQKESRVFMRSVCSEHGEIVSDHVWDDPEIYKGLKKVKLAAGKAEQIVFDTTKKCNLNCKICFARANEYQGNEFKREGLDRFKNYRQVFLSGGEPTTREDLPALIRRCVKNKQKPILFTNGIKLTDLSYLKKLKDAGLRSVLLQFDTLNEEDCEYIRGKSLVKTKIQALRNLKKLNIPVSIWAVVVRGRNSGELEKISRFVMKFPNVKTFSAIPIWRIGRYKQEDFIPPSEIIRNFGEIYGISKAEFVSTTQFVCNIDRILSLFYKKRGKLFGVCMIKGLIFESKDGYLTLGQIFNVEKINKRVEKIFARDRKLIGLMAFLGYFIKTEIFLNFIKNKNFRMVLLRLAANLRFVPEGRYLLLNPFRFITVGIFPSAKNIDLDFIKACNSYAFSNDDYSTRPACLHYIEQDNKSDKTKE